MELEERIAAKTAEALEEVYGTSTEPGEIVIQNTKAEFEGDRTVMAFPLAKKSKAAPEETAETLGKYLRDHLDLIADYNVIKGFLNLVVRDDFWLRTLTEARNTERYGYAPENTGRTVMVEFSSPNTNKPLHLGHLRNNFLGFSVSRILEANGHKVHKVQIVNDRGIHICKAMLAWQKFGQASDGVWETPENTGMKGDKLVGKYYVLFEEKEKAAIEALKEKEGKSPEEAEKESPLLQEAQEMLRKWEAGDPDVIALWERMNDWVYKGFDETYERMGVHFDKLYYESDTYLFGREKVYEGLENGVFYQKNDGSVWCDLSAHGLDDKLLIRADGTAVYMTQDIGTAIRRYQDEPELSQLIYTVGNEQEHHFRVLFIILEKLGYTWARHCYHLAYGMVDLPHGKMKSREGTVVEADELMAEMVSKARATTDALGKSAELDETEREKLYEDLGVGAIKYFLLKVSPEKKMLFDPEGSIDLNGDTGPFLQYGHARIMNLLRKAKEQGYRSRMPEEPTFSLDPSERALLQRIHAFPERVREAGERYDPSRIADHLFELVKTYNHFYQTVPVLRSEEKERLEFRLAMCEQVGVVIRSAAWLIGMEMPNVM